LTYTFVVTNNDPVIAPNVVMSADIPAGSTWVTTTGRFNSDNRVASDLRDSYVRAAGSVFWQGGLASGASHTIVYVVRANILVGSLIAGATALSDDRAIYSGSIETGVVPVAQQMLPLVSK
jgi:uncharacterized repeat protein (TIGR01451 family)